MKSAFCSAMNGTYLCARGAGHSGEHEAVGTVSRTYRGKIRVLVWGSNGERWILRSVVSP